MTRQFLYCCMWIHCCGNVFTKPLPSNGCLVWVCSSSLQLSCHNIDLFFCVLYTSTVVNHKWESFNVLFSILWVLITIVAMFDLWSYHYHTVHGHLCFWDQFSLYLLLYSNIIGHSTAPKLNWKPNDWYNWLPCLFMVDTLTNPEFHSISLTALNWTENWLIH
jgi:hypothetical protein